MQEVVEKLNETLVSTTGSSPIPKKNTEGKPIPRDIYSAAAIFAREGSENISPQDDFTEALGKYAQAMEKLSLFKTELNMNIQEKFITPMKDVMEVLFQQANESRKILGQMRRTFDSTKSRCRNASQERLESLNHELEAAESDYNKALTDATRRIKSVVENPLVIQYVADLIEAQRKFHKQSYEILNGVIIV
jgi:HPt (histidine-containing phosphotransfer) domain-containing protein